MHLVDYGDLIRRITEEGVVLREPERFVINAQVLRELGENTIYYDIHGEEFVNTWATIFGEPVASDRTISAESAERIYDLLEANSTIRPIMLPLSAFESPNETLNMVAPRGYSRSLALATARSLIGGRDKWFPYQDEWLGKKSNKNCSLPKKLRRATTGWQI